MMTLTIILGIVTVIANATSDEIKHHWDRLFAHWFPSGKDKWWNPSISWKNKYTNNRFTTFLLSVPFVMFTDFWHLLKFITLNSVFGIVLSIARLQWGIWDYVVAILLLNIVWGIIFETVLGIYGALSDKYMK